METEAVSSSSVVKKTTTTTKSGSGDLDCWSWSEEDEKVRIYPYSLPTDQNMKVTHLESDLRKNIRAVPGFDRLDAENALKVFYTIPGTLRQHLAGKLLQDFGWLYFVQYNFWYLSAKHPVVDIRCVFYYNIGEGRLVSQRADTFYATVQKFHDTGRNTWFGNLFFIKK